MAMIASQTFVDRLNEAEIALSELTGYAEHLANRLVGYADLAETDGPGFPPSSGILPDVGDTATRMARKIRETRQSLARISEILPAETDNAIAKSATSLGPLGQAKW